jgi:UDPglucose 6-dehydrogenase/GDP-mannose 6-dehydrogenase
MKVSIIGTGYVGLVSGVSLAHVGHDVTCVDLDEAKVQRINDGDSPIHENGLPELLAGVLATGRFRATTDLPSAVQSTELTLIAVGTPFGEDRIDLGQIEAAATQIGAALANTSNFHVVVVKSTVVPGTTEDVVVPAVAAASGKTLGIDFGAGMNPEFLREGVAVDDFLEPDRIVLGGTDEQTVAVMARLYEDAFPQTPLLRTTPRTAEMIKYTANSLLATAISFSNEIGNLCSELGVDSTEVFGGVHLDRRLSPIIDGERIDPQLNTYFMAGAGFGGSCFPKDVKALVAHGERVGLPMQILRSVVEVNERQPMRMVELASRHVELDGARVAVLGAAFKPETDDIRESPTLVIVPELRARGASVVVHDPIATDNAREVLGSDGISYTTDLGQAVADADAVLLITSWPAYKELEKWVDGSVPVIDGRRFLDATDFGIYDGIGFPASETAGDR